MFNTIVILIGFLLLMSIFKLRYTENMYFNIPTRYCNPSKIMSYDIRGDIPIPIKQIHTVPFNSSEFIQNTPKECIDYSNVSRSILTN